MAEEPAAGLIPETSREQAPEKLVSVSVIEPVPQPHPVVSPASAAAIPQTSRGPINKLQLNQPDVPFPLLKNDLKRQEKLYKVLVIGDVGVGKTSVVKRYVHRFFSLQYRATIGVDFALKVINWDQNTVIRLQLWDIAGQERFGHMTRVYYKDAVGAFVVFDMGRTSTFEAVAKWKRDLDNKVETPDGNQVPCVLLGNKCDEARDAQIPEGSRMDQFLRENKFSGFFETSAKENVGIDEAARYLLFKIMESDHSNEVERDTDRFQLDSFPEMTRKGANNHANNCSC